MSRAVVGQTSRLPLGRLAPAFVGGETPAQAAGTAAPLPIGFNCRFAVQMRRKILRRYIQNRISQSTNRTAAPWTKGS